MAHGRDQRDRLAYELVQSSFDAVERDGYRAAWTSDDAAVRVRHRESGEKRVYDAEDLLRAASDREVANARSATGE